MNVNLHIERLVLDGLPLNRPQSAVLKSSLERELARLLEHRGINTLASGAVPELSAAAIQLSPDGRPAQWGRQIAHSLFSGMTSAPANVAQPKHLRGGANPPPASRQPAAH
jgi:hypothetical protein